MIIRTNYLITKEYLKYLDDVHQVEELRRETRDLIDQMTPKIAGMLSQQNAIIVVDDQLSAKRRRRKSAMRLTPDRVYLPAGPHPVVSASLPDGTAEPEVEPAPPGILARIAPPFARVMT